MPDLFISYSSKNQKEADRLCQALELVDVTCWIASRDIPAGSDYAREIPGAIDRADAVVILVSRESQTSEHVVNELALAAQAKKPMVPYRLDDAPLVEDHFRYHLTARNWVDGTGNRYEALWELLKEVKKLRLQKKPENRTPEVLEAEKRVDQVAEVFIGLASIILLFFLQAIVDGVVTMLPLSPWWMLAVRTAVIVVTLYLVIRISVWIIGGRQQTIRYLKELVQENLTNRKKERK